MKVLFAVDGSDYTVKAAHFRQFHALLELHLLHVQPPIPRGLALAQEEKLLGGDVDDRYYREESEAALAPAEQILRKQQVSFDTTYKVGDIEQEIHRHAVQNKMDMIVMGSHGHGAFKNLVMGSVVTKVLAMETDTPDELIAKADEAMYLAKKCGGSNFQFPVRDAS